jgi:exonuclease SbcC
MIKTLILHNFQSHKNSRVDLHPGVNVIIGQSDSGKTALLRALHWLITNKPSGDSFRSHWGGDTQVSIEVDDMTIGRLKTSKENSYYDSVGPAGGVVSYKAMAQGVPEEIEKYLNIKEINIQRQMDAPFLLSASSGEVARYLNEIVRLDVIDQALSSIQKKTRSFENSLSAEQEHLKQLQHELAQYDYLKDAEEKVQEVEDLTLKASRLRSDEMALTNLIDDIRQMEEDASKYEYILSCEKQVQQIEKLIKEKEEKEIAWTLLSRMINEIRKLTTELKRVESEKSSLEGQFKKFIGTNCAACGQIIRRL